MEFLKKLLPIIAVLVVLVGTIPPAYSQGTLYGSDASENVFSINIATGQGTLIGNLGIQPFGTEIECTLDGSQCFYQGRDGNFIIQQFNLATIAPIGPIVPDGAAFNGLEYVGNTLYGTSITASCTPSTLNTLNPLTGVSVPIGAGTGTGFPMSGLAYDTVNAIMYGIDGCGNQAGPSNLWTVNLNTGLAAVVGNTGQRLASLQYGPDGQLYAGGDGNNGGNIYTINTNTGAATLVGPSFFNQVTGLTLVDNPIQIGGDIIPIETTSLILAGAQSFSWMIPVVLSIVGIGIVFLRRK